jgi:hypothetical protein
MYYVLYLVKDGQFKHLRFLVSLTSVLIIVILFCGFCNTIFRKLGLFSSLEFNVEEGSYSGRPFFETSFYHPLSNREQRAFVKRMMKVGIHKNQEIVAIYATVKFS